MNNEQVWSAIRQLMLVGGGYFVHKGYVDTNTLSIVVGALIVLMGSGWALFTRRYTGLIAAAANVPSVSQIVTSSPTAQNLPSEKVVAPAQATQ